MRIYTVKFYQDEKLKSTKTFSKDSLEEVYCEADNVLRKHPKWDWEVIVPRKENENISH